MWLAWETKVPLRKWKRVIDGQPFTVEELARDYRLHRGQVNPSIVTGAPSGVTVIDADNQAGVDWIKANVPPTPALVATSKGAHFYNRHNVVDGAFNRTDALGSRKRFEWEAAEAGFDVRVRVTVDDPNAEADERQRVTEAVASARAAGVVMGPVIDIRGDGGQVVAPGGVHRSGHVYAWVDEPSPDMWSAMPVFDQDWFKGRKWMPPRRVVGVSLDQVSETVVADKISRALTMTGDQRAVRARAWAMATPGAVEGQNGQVMSFYVACRLVNGFALDLDDAFEIMCAWNETCSPPWSAADVARMVERARLYAGDRDGFMLLDRPEWEAKRRARPILETVVVEDEDFDVPPAPAPAPANELDDMFDDVEPQAPASEPSAVPEPPEPPPAPPPPPPSQPPPPPPPPQPPPPPPPATPAPVRVHWSWPQATDADMESSWRKMFTAKGIDYDAARASGMPVVIKPTTTGGWRLPPDPVNLHLAMTFSRLLTVSLYEDRLKSRVVVNGEDMVAGTELFIKRQLEVLWQQKLPITDVNEVIRHAAMANAREPVRELLESLPAWDGGDHVRTLLTTVLGAEYTDVNYAMLRHWLTAAVARAIEPGSKFDNIIVLYGPQGAKKSGVLRALAYSEFGSDRKWFTDNKVLLHNRDSQMLIASHWIVEWSEAEHAKSEKNIDSVKSFLAQLFDTYRPPYGRDIEDRPRRCVFAATSNDPELIHDVTGSRRFYILNTAADVDMDTLFAVRDQIWAQALDLWRRHRAAAPGSAEWHATRWWFDRAEDAAREDAMRAYLSRGAWDDEIEQWVMTRALLRAAERRLSPDTDDISQPWLQAQAFRIADVFDNVLKTPVDRRTRRLETEIRRKLQALGCVRVRGGGMVYMPDGRGGRFWLPPELTLAQELEIGSGDPEF